MGPHEHMRRPVQEVLVQALGVEVGPVDVEGVLHPGVVDAVGILLFETGADGVEVLRHLQGLADGDVLRRVGVDGEGQALQGDAALRAEVRDVALGVDAGVRPAAARQVDILPRDLAEGLLQRLADGDGVALHLPAVVGGAVIHEF